MHQILSFIKNHRGPWPYVFKTLSFMKFCVGPLASLKYNIDKSGLHFSIAVNIRTISIFSICLWKQQNWQFNSGTQNATKIRTTKPKSLQKVFPHPNAKKATANGWTYWQARQLDGWYDSLSDVPESRVWFASKNLTPCRMHWNDFLIGQIIAECHSFPNMYDML